MSRFGTLPSRASYQPGREVMELSREGLLRMACEWPMMKVGGSPSEPQTLLHSDYLPTPVTLACVAVWMCMCVVCTLVAKHLVLCNSLSTRGGCK